MLFCLEYLGVTLKTLGFAIDEAQPYKLLFLQVETDLRAMSNHRERTTFQSQAEVNGRRRLWMSFDPVVGMTVQYPDVPKEFIALVG